MRCGSSWSGKGRNRLPIEVFQANDHTELLVNEARLKQSTTTQLVPQIEIDREVVLRLDQVRFIEPFGLVFLYWLVRDLLRRGAPRVLVRGGSSVWEDCSPLPGTIVEIVWDPRQHRDQA